MNLCVQSRYIHLWMHYLLALWRERVRFGAGCLSAGSHIRLWESPAYSRAGGALLSGPDVDTAVYIYGLACDVVTVFYKVADGPGDLFRFSEAAEGHLFTELLLGFLGDVGDHIGLYESGADGVDGDPESGQFLGRRLGEAEKPGLGRRVVGLAYIACLSDEGAHVDDLAPALVRHVRQYRVDRVEGAVEVYLYDFVPVVDGELPERAVDVDPSVVDQDVYPVEPLQGLIYELLGLLCVRDVSLNRYCFPTAFRDLVDQLLGRLLAPGVVDDDFGSSTSQLLRYGFAQTPARAGHDDNGFFQGAHTILLFPFACRAEFIDCTEQAQDWSKHRDATHRLLLQVRSWRNPGAVQENGRAMLVEIGSASVLVG